MTDDTDLGSRHLEFERRGPVAWVTIDRPERRNALTSNMYFGIRRAVDRVNASQAPRARRHRDRRRVRARRRARRSARRRPVNIGELLGTGAVPFDAIRDSRKPVIAAVNGLCMGGGLLITMLSDVAIASDRAVFGAPELRRGVADAYHAAILPEHVGIAIARDMLFTATAPRPHPKPNATGSSLGSCRTSSSSPTTEEVVRELLRAAPRRTGRVEAADERALRRDRPDHVRRVGHGDEVVEGFRAFVDKRDPAWVPRP
jgi:enoyl-CoA hydratase